MELLYLVITVVVFNTANYKTGCFSFFNFPKIHYTF